MLKGKKGIPSGRAQHQQEKTALRHFSANDVEKGEEGDEPRFRPVIGEDGEQEGKGQAGEETVRYRRSPFHLFQGNLISMASVSNFTFSTWTFAC